ncbi:MAG TPA: hypothetical protein VGZ00_12380 [Candidatus Baltobacteraceae bacterium]|jgi:hypothetical protein|nr:hypothetical protein [Candidatus Baltobacteraceae bacterium]
MANLPEELVPSDQSTSLKSVLEDFERAADELDKRARTKEMLFQQIKARLERERRDFEAPPPSEPSSKDQWIFRVRKRLGNAAFAIEEWAGLTRRPPTDYKIVISQIENTSLNRVFHGAFQREHAQKLRRDLEERYTIRTLRAGGTSYCDKRGYEVMREQTQRNLNINTNEHSEPKMKRTTRILVYDLDRIHIDSAAKLARAVGYPAALSRSSSFFHDLALTALLEHAVAAEAEFVQWTWEQAKSLAPVERNLAVQLAIDELIDESVPVIEIPSREYIKILRDRKRNEVIPEVSKLIEMRQEEQQAERERRFDEQAALLEHHGPAASRSEQARIPKKNSSSVPSKWPSQLGQG